MKIDYPILLSEEIQVPFRRVKKGMAKDTTIYLSREIRLELRNPDGSVIRTIQCSSHDLEHMVRGFLLAEGYIDHISDVTQLDIHLDEEYVTVYRKPKEECPPFEWPTIDSEKTYPIEDILACGPLLDSISEAHHRTHGVHEGAIVKDGVVIAYTEDIGRHNVLDRLFSIVQTEGIDVSETILIFSGRVPYSVISKVRKMGFPIICSRAVPTSLGIDLAQKENITLINGLRFNACNIFAHPERIIVDTVSE